MKIQVFTLCFLAIFASVNAENPQTTSLTSQPVHLNNHPATTQTPLSRKNFQVSTPLPFTQDLSTQPIGQQAYNAFQSGFPNAFGSFSTHNPNSPSFSVDPMISSGSISMANPNARPNYPLQGQSFGFPPLVRNDHSITRYNDDNLAYGGVSLSSGIFPRLKAKDRCRVIQQQAVQVANNLVKRQNKVIFKELMNYILKSKFLIGMTEVKLNRVLKRKFVALMKKYTVLSDDNVRLIASEDDEIIDSELEDEDDDLNDKVDFNDPFRSNAADIDEENMDWKERDGDQQGFNRDYEELDNRMPTIIPDADNNVPSLDGGFGTGQGSQPSMNGGAGTGGTTETAATPAAPTPAAKKPWYKRIFDWKQQRALQAQNARRSRQMSKQTGGKQAKH